MAFRPERPETKRRNAERRGRERVATSAALTARLLAAYESEPDREYAEAFWGSMLRERGVSVG